MTLNYVICACMDKTSENEYNAIYKQVTMYNIYGISSIQRIVVFFIGPASAKKKEVLTFTASEIRLFVHIIIIMNSAVEFQCILLTE